MKVDSLIWVQFLALVVLCVSSTGRSAVPKDPFLGISPQDESYYKVSSDTIKCKDGSGGFSKAQLNDDFCDCADSTDEPGTSACPGGKFYCRNDGHTPLKIFSSRVNDGICDCCDGSDEYDGQVNCPNTCWEAGKVARDKLRKKIATYKEGAVIRKKEVEEAKRAIAKDEAELAKLKSEESVLKGLVQQLKDRKEQIEKAEERERLQKEKEEKERKEAEEKSDKVESGGEDEDKDKNEDEAKQGTVQTEDTTDNEDKPLESINDEIGLLDDTPPNKDVPDVEFESSSTAETEGSPVNGMEQLAAKEHEESASPESKDDAVVVSENGDDVGTKDSHEQMKGENDLSTSTEGLSKEELGRLVASRWTGTSAKKTEESESTQHNDHEDSDEISQDTHDEEDDGYNSETDDDTGKYDDDTEKYDDDTGKYDDADVEDIEETYEEDVHDDAGSSYKSDDELDFSDTNSLSGLSWLEKIQQTVRNLVQAVNFFQAPVDKSEADRIRKEYEESNTKLTKMQSRISTLTEKLKNDYGKEKEFYSFYDRCFESKQNKYVYKVCPFKQASQVEGHATTRLGRWEKFEDSYRSMIFANGDKCWNGPDRSMKVKLRCGLTNAIADVDEPSRCEYIALLSTPTLCLEEKLKELEDKLELMEKPQPQIHDEL